MWIVYSLGNRNLWFGSLREYLDIEEILSSHNDELRRMDGFEGLFFHYFMMTEEYQETVKKTIDDILTNDILNNRMEAELISLRAVYRSGPVLMG
ncbi:MAG: hypothetical protein FD164_1884 [Nitrospirae bacterium]|nr:MAG: hypothetical protein FD164_1884 [Nitrospirota bacterium]